MHEIEFRFGVAVLDPASAPETVALMTPIAAMLAAEAVSIERARRALLAGRVFGLTLLFGSLFWLILEAAYG